MFSGLTRPEGTPHTLQRMSKVYLMITNRAAWDDPFLEASNAFVFHRGLKIWAILAQEWGNHLRTAELIWLGTYPLVICNIAIEHGDL